MTLKELRISKGFSQVDAAKFLNIPLRSYKRYEADFLHSKSLKIRTIFDALKNCKNKVNKDKEIHFPEVSIIGAGFVGYNFGKMLSQKCNVSFVDIDKNKRSKLRDESFNAYDSISEIRKVEVAIICLPTNFNNKDDFEVDAIIKSAKEIINKNKNALIIIKSTVNIGFSRKLQTIINHPIYFMPEFLREKYAEYDSLYPNKIIIGGDRVSKGIRNFSKVVEICTANKIKPIFMSLEEAEATKLYSNAYLAMRVAFFNEIDSFSIDENLDSKKIISAMGLDPRIGDSYNNPSFGYSGYCLPKDTKVLLKRTKSKIIASSIESNEERKEKIASEIIKQANKIKQNATIGIFNIESLKTNGKYRESSTIEIMHLLEKYPGKVVVFDENYDKSICSFDEFIKVSDLIVTNSYNEKLSNTGKPIFTRSLYINSK